MGSQIQQSLIGGPQHIVYWNDGETCYFSAHTDGCGLKVNGISEDDEYDDVYLMEQKIKKYKDMALGSSEVVIDGKPLEEAVTEKEEEMNKLMARGIRIANLKKSISNLLGAFDDDDFLIMFGDHAMVHITRDGIEVEIYTDHN